MPTNKKQKELSLLQKLEKSARQKKLERFSAESTKWYRNKVRTLGGDKTRDTLLQQQKKRGYGLARNPGPGNMYAFVYDAKHKDTLPYWDAFPLILLLDVGPGWFTGLNLHYASPKMRAGFMDKIIEYRTDDRYNNRTKIQLTYSMLKSASNLSLFKHMYKKYLNTQVASTIIKIPSPEWEAALYMPVSDFQKASNSKVWMDAGKYK